MQIGHSYGRERANMASLPPPLPPQPIAYSDFLHVIDKPGSVANFLQRIETSDARNTKILRSCVIVGRNIINDSSSMANRDDGNNNYNSRRPAILAEEITEHIVGLEKLKQSTMRMYPHSSDVDLYLIDRKYNTVEIDDFTRLNLFQKYAFSHPLPSSSSSSSSSTHLEYTHEICEMIFNELPPVCKYWHNVILPLDNSLLYEATVITSQIHPTNNKDVDRMDGINEPMYYFGVQFSFSEMHLEDGDLPSLNIVHFNFKKNTANVSMADDGEAPSSSLQPAKVWLIVPDKPALFGKIQTAQCSHAILHKNIYVTCKFLKRHNIYYFFVLQYPGDIVYLKSSVFHQIVNLTPNFAEAINYGSREWNSIRRTISSCECEEKKYTDIYNNQEVVSIAKTRDIKLHRCSIVGCEHAFRNINSLGQHMKIAHEISKPFKCPRCEKSWAVATSLTTHCCFVADCDDPRTLLANRPMHRCEICDLAVLSKAKHERTFRHRTLQALVDKSTVMTATTTIPTSGDDNNEDHNDDDDDAAMNLHHPPHQGHADDGDDTKPADAFAAVGLNEAILVNNLRMCPKCHRGFRDSDTLQLHIDVCSARTTRYACSGCDKTFTTSSSRNRHAKRHAAVASPLSFIAAVSSNPTNIRLICSKCKAATFHSKTELAKHITRCVLHLQYPCISCTKRFDSSSTLQRHVRCVHERNSHLAS